MIDQVTQPIQPRQRVQIISCRLTCLGLQYRVSDDYGTEIVTVNNGCIGCTCGLDESFLVCSHITIVENRRAEDQANDIKRDLMHDVFDVTNQQMKEVIYG